VTRGLLTRRATLAVPDDAGMAAKAIFLDVDGTLVNDSGLVPDSARTAIRVARSHGHVFS
jgi:hypothetical protein